MPNSLEGCDGWVEGRGILHIHQSLAWSSGKIAPGGPSSGLKESILFLEIVDFLFLWSSEAAIGGGGGRAAPRWT